MDKLWCNDVRILSSRDRLHEFWPTREMHFNERMNALSRFCIYGGILISIHKKDPFYMVLAMLLMSALTLIAQAKEVKPKSSGLQPAHAKPEHNKMTSKACQKPTKDNPMANYMLTDAKDRPPACPSEEVVEAIDDTFFAQFDRDPFDIFNKKHSQRQFFSTANTESMNDQQGFATWLYGNSNKTCKENPSMCTGMESSLAGNSGPSSS